MKIQGELYDRMKAAIAGIVDANGADKIREVYTGHSQQRMLWDIWHAGNRGFAIDPYKAGLNDNHVETAIKRIAKELGLI